MTQPLRLRAAWTLPISSPPIENGEIVVEEGRIVEVRPIPVHGAAVMDARDFGEAILMPGLVNVHTHLDYTVLRGLIEDREFFSWIRELVSCTQLLEEEDYIASASLGAAEAVAAGVTTIGDCTPSGAAMIAAKRAGLRGIVYQEVFGIDEQQSIGQIMADLDYRVQALTWQAAGSNLKVGVSPHAPYTVRPELFQAVAAYALNKRLPICIHAAESLAESQLIREGVGPFAQMFHHRGIQWQAPGRSPIAYLHALGMLSERTLLVHGVQLCASDRELIEKTGTAWAHCPKSNAKLGNGVASLGLLQQCYSQSVARIGLGSDSVASNNGMDLFEEMRFAILMQRGRRRSIEAPTASEIVEMATLGGARALGLEGKIGSLEAGKEADIIAVRTDSPRMMPCYDPYNALVYAASATDVVMTMVSGEILYQEGVYTRFNPKESLGRFREAADRLRRRTRE
jgi:5-methylthioadenosine/S-adenosylhomocysteine deaminase